MTGALSDRLPDTVDGSFRALAFRLDKIGDVSVSQAEFVKGVIAYRCVAPARN